MKKGAMVPVLQEGGKSFLKGCHFIRELNVSQLHLWLRFRVPHFGAQVLPRGTFGAFVSGYFSNHPHAKEMEGHSVIEWPNTL